MTGDVLPVRVAGVRSQLLPRGFDPPPEDPRGRVDHRHVVGRGPMLGNRPDLPGQRRRDRRLADVPAAVADHEVAVGRLEPSPQFLLVDVDAVLADEVREVRTAHLRVHPHPLGRGVAAGGTLDAPLPGAAVRLHAAALPSNGPGRHSGQAGPPVELPGTGRRRAPQ